MKKTPCEKHRRSRTTSKDFSCCEPELRYRTLFEQSPDGLLIIDQDGNFVDFNESAHRQLGYSREEFSKLSISDIDSLQSPEDVGRSMREVLAKGRADFEVTHRTKTGVEREVHVITQVIQIEGRTFFHAIWRDITEHKRAEENLRKSEERYKKLFDTTMDGIFQVNEQGLFTLINPAGAKIFGHRSPEEMIGQPARRYWNDRAASDTYLRELQDAKSLSSYPIRARKIDGTPVDLECSSRIIEDENSRRIGVEGILRDVTERRRIEEQLRSMSLTDDLTGLNNRRGFFTLGDHVLKLAMREMRGLYMLYADLNGLKRINDTFGHKEGDKALADTAAILRKTFRKSDVIARLGGDEFAVLPVGFGGDNVRAITERLQKNLGRHNEKMRLKSYILSLSLGIAYYDPQEPCKLEDLLTRADKLMYEDKKKAIRV